MVKPRSPTPPGHRLSLAALSHDTDNIHRHNSFAFGVFLVVWKGPDVCVTRRQVDESQVVPRPLVEWTSGTSGHVTQILVLFLSFSYVSRGPRGWGSPSGLVSLFVYGLIRLKGHSKGKGPLHTRPLPVSVDTHPGARGGRSVLLVKDSWYRGK